MPIREPLPDVFRARFGALEEQCPTTQPGDLFYHCFDCGPEHPIGLRVRCFKTDDGVLAPILVPRRYEGPQGGPPMAESSQPTSTRFWPGPPSARPAASPSPAS